MRIQLNLKQTSVPNMIPTIDILFQLVIFFMLACQFAVVEQFPIPVPDSCKNATDSNSPARDILTITIMQGSGELEIAVGPERITSAQGGEQMASQITEAINSVFKSQPAGPRTVCLRIAKDVPFEKSQYAIQAVSNSNATDIQMAVLKDKAPVN